MPDCSCVGNQRNPKAAFWEAIIKKQEEKLNRLRLQKYELCTRIKELQIKSSPTFFKSQLRAINAACNGQQKGVKLSCPCDNLNEFQQAHTEHDSGSCTCAESPNAEPNDVCTCSEDVQSGAAGSGQLMSCSCGVSLESGSDSPQGSCTCSKRSSTSEEYHSAKRNLGSFRSCSCAESVAKSSFNSFLVNGAKTPPEIGSCTCSFKRSNIGESCSCTPGISLYSGGTCTCTIASERSGQDVGTSCACSIENNSGSKATYGCSCGTNTQSEASRAGVSDKSCTCSVGTSKGISFRESNIGSTRRSGNGECTCGSKNVCTPAPTQTSTFRSQTICICHAQPVSNVEPDITSETSCPCMIPEKDVTSDSRKSKRKSRSSERPCSCGSKPPQNDKKKPITMCTDEGAFDAFKSQPCNCPAAQQDKKDPNASGMICGCGVEYIPEAKPQLPSGKSCKCSLAPKPMDEGSNITCPCGVNSLPDERTSSSTKSCLCSSPESERSANASKKSCNCSNRSGTANSGSTEDEVSEDAYVSVNTCICGSANSERARLKKQPGNVKKSYESRSAPEAACICNDNTQLAKSDKGTYALGESCNCVNPPPEDNGKIKQEPEVASNQKSNGDTCSCCCQKSAKGGTKSCSCANKSDVSNVEKSATNTPFPDKEKETAGDGLSGVTCSCDSQSVDQKKAPDNILDDSCSCDFDDASTKKSDKASVQKSANEKSTSDFKSCTCVSIESPKENVKSAGLCNCGLDQTSEKIAKFDKMMVEDLGTCNCTLDMLKKPELPSSDGACSCSMEKIRMLREIQEMIKSMQKCVRSDDKGGCGCGLKNVLDTKSEGTKTSRSCNCSASSRDYSSEGSSYTSTSSFSTPCSCSSKGKKSSGMCSCVSQSPSVKDARKSNLQSICKSTCGLNKNQISSPSINAEGPYVSITIRSCNQSSRETSNANQDISKVTVGSGKKVYVCAPAYSAVEKRPCPKFAGYSQSQTGCPQACSSTGVATSSYPNTPTPKTKTDYICYSALSQVVFSNTSNTYNSVSKKTDILSYVSYTSNASKTKDCTLSVSRSTLSILSFKDLTYTSKSMSEMLTLSDDFKLIPKRSSSDTLIQSGSHNALSAVELSHPFASLKKYVGTGEVHSKSKSKDCAQDCCVCLTLGCLSDTKTSKGATNVQLVSHKQQHTVNSTCSPIQIQPSSKHCQTKQSKRRESSRCKRNKIKASCAQTDSNTSICSCTLQEATTKTLEDYGIVENVTITEYRRERKHRHKRSSGEGRQNSKHSQRSIPRRDYPREGWFGFYPPINFNPFQYDKYNNKFQNVKGYTQFGTPESKLCFGEEANGFTNQKVSDDSITALLEGRMGNYTPSFRL